MVPYHLEWRGLQNRRAGFESRKEPQPIAIAARVAAGPGELRPAGPAGRAESPGPWLTVEQNAQLAAAHTAAHTSPHAPGPGPESDLDSRTSCRVIEIFAAMLPIEWG